MVRMTEKEDIQNIVDSLAFRDDDYKPSRFDCVQMSTLVFDELERAGYQPEFIAGWNGRGRGHLWIEVEDLEVESTWKKVRCKQNFLKYKASLKRFSNKLDLEEFVLHEHVRARIRDPWLGVDKLEELKIEWPNSGEHFCISRKGLDQEIFSITEGATRIIGTIEGNLFDIKVPQRDRPKLLLIRIYYNRRKSHGIYPPHQEVLEWKDFGMISFDLGRVDLKDRHIIFKGDYSSWNFKATKRDFDRLSKISLLDTEKSSV